MSAWRGFYARPTGEAWSAPSRCCRYVSHIATVIYYSEAQSRGTDVQAAIERFFEEFRDSPEVREDAEDAGVELDEIAQTRGDISARDTDAGLDPITTGIAINIASHLAIKAWERVIGPWLRSQLGDDGLGKEAQRKQDEDD